MLQDFRRPAWCQEIVITADAAYASRANLTLLQELGYGYVVTRPRTWKFANGKTLKALVTHLPRWKYTQIRIPTVNCQRRRTVWVDAKRARLRHLGEVTVVLSTCRRHDAPKQTKILVTNLPEPVTAREIVGVYRRRWWIARLLKELKGGRGHGPASGYQTDHTCRTRGGRGDHGVCAPAQALGAGCARRSPVERVSPATRVCLGGDAGPVRAFGPSDGSEVASIGQSRMTTCSYLSPLSELGSG